MSLVYALPFQFALPKPVKQKPCSFELTESVPLRLAFNEKGFLKRVFRVESSERGRKALSFLVLKSKGIYSTMDILQI